MSSNTLSLGQVAGCRTQRVTAHLRRKCTVRVTSQQPAVKALGTKQPSQGRGIGFATRAAKSKEIPQLEEVRLTRENGC